MKRLFTEVGKTPRVKDIQAIAFHDLNGRIHHMHHVILLEGSLPVEYKTIKQEAYEQAKTLGVDVSRLKTFHASNIQNPHAMHRIDMKKKELVEVKVKKPLSISKR
jgi:hypothetical protein